MTGGILGIPDLIQDVTDENIWAEQSLVWRGAMNGSHHFLFEFLGSTNGPGLAIFFALAVLVSGGIARYVASGGPVKPETIMIGIDCCIAAFAVSFDRILDSANDLQRMASGFPLSYQPTGIEDDLVAASIYAPLTFVVFMIVMLIQKAQRSEFTTRSYAHRSLIAEALLSARDRVVNNLPAIVSTMVGFSWLVSFYWFVKGE